MKILILILAPLLLLTASCSKSSTGTLSPIQQVACDIETDLNTSFSAAVATALSCTNQAAIQSSLALAFGNANLCTGQVASVTAAQLSAARAAVKANAVSAKGVIANLACPVAVSSALGFLSNAIPSAWGCSATATASALSATLTTLCEALPI
jgi:hypothetical protein